VHKEFAIQTANEIDVHFAKFEQEPTIGQKDRGEILLALLVSNGGKMLAKDARQQMKSPVVAQYPGIISSSALRCLRASSPLSVAL
jgi:hypothetical protein